MNGVKPGVWRLLANGLAVKTLAESGLSLRRVPVRVLVQAQNQTSSETEIGLDPGYIALLCVGITLLVILAGVCVCKAGDIARCLRRCCECCRKPKTAVEPDTPRFPRADSYREQHSPIPQSFSDLSQTVPKMDKSTDRPLVSSVQEQEQAGRRHSKTRLEGCKEVTVQVAPKPAERPPPKPVKKPRHGPRLHKSSVNVTEFAKQGPKTPTENKSDRERVSVDAKQPHRRKSQNLVPNVPSTRHVHAQGQRRFSWNRPVRTKTGGEKPSPPPARKDS